MAVLKREILQELSHPEIEKKVTRIVNSGNPRSLRDMVLFAEYLEKKHHKGFVVYWCEAGVPRFEVMSWDAWQDEHDAPYNRDTHWHTSLCDVRF